MTELEMRTEEFLQRIDQNQPLTVEEAILLRRAFRAGFLICRDMACEELSYIAPYFFANGQKSLGGFLERRCLAIYALGDSEIESLYAQEG